MEYYCEDCKKCTRGWALDPYECRTCGNYFVYAEVRRRDKIIGITTLVAFLVVFFVTCWASQ